MGKQPSVAATQLLWEKLSLHRVRAPRVRAIWSRTICPIVMVIYWRNVTRSLSSQWFLMAHGPMISEALTTKQGLSSFPNFCTFLADGREKPLLQPKNMWWALMNVSNFHEFSLRTLKQNLDKRENVLCLFLSVTIDRPDAWFRCRLTKSKTSGLKVNEVLSGCSK